MGYLARVVLSVLCANILLHILQCDCQTVRKEAFMSVPKLITAAGYPSEKHRAHTEDGYSLQMHRIPAGRRTARKSEPKGKKAVLVMHGLLSSSEHFVISGPERGLPFLLADAGYDVWLGNFRGNLYTTHKNLSRNDPKFWEYSFHEHGKYDNPAMIDYILNATGLPKLLYIGHSMGTTSFFTMLAQRPEYNDKIVSFVALAPAVYLDNIKSIASMLLKTLDLPNTMRSEGMIYVYLYPRLTDFIIANFCPEKNLIHGVCIPLFNALVGQDDEQADWEILKLAISRLQPASWRQLEHYGKIAITGVFTSWEDGLWGEVKPYNLTNVKVPVSLLYGENDQLTEKSQIMKLAAQLNKTGMLEEVRPGCSWPKFNHIDFIFAKDLADLLNKPLVKYIDKMYNKYG